MFSLVTRRAAVASSSFLHSVSRQAGIYTHPKKFSRSPQVFFIVQRRWQTNSASMTNSTFVVKRVNNITKSPHDQREYRGIELTNGLRVLLVSDPTTDKSAASMDVGCGHLMDPWNMPGTAHFCEHMLFLGTDKYPSENEYSKFISAHAGNTNAYTASDHTNYHFDVKTEQLYGALDRFVQFFLAPQFTESATEREVCAVDSEHSNNLKNDAWRQLQVERFLSKEGHDYGKFGTGDKKTLLEDAKLKGLEPREELLKFHSKWYSSNIMTCVIVGKESLDELEQFVGTLQFDKIENKQVEKVFWKDHPYGKEQLGRKVHVVPIKDSRSLKLSFPVPYLRHEYKSQPDHYLSHLLGHEGPGSLLSELKRLGWVSSLTSGQNNLARGMATFEVQVDLSNEGLKHTEEIVELVFQYIGMLRQSGLDKWIQEELRDIGNTKFVFQDKNHPLTAATTMASNLQHVPFDDILTCSYTMPEFRPDLINSILECLVPENMFYRVVSKSFAGQEGNSTEPVYGTEIKIDNIQQDAITKFRNAMNVPHNAFKLPEKNEYIPTKFDLKATEASKSDDPRIIYDDPWTRVWFKQDDEYKLPKMITKVSITSPMVNRCPRTALLSSIYLWCLNDALAEETYNPNLAGLKFELDVGSSGGNIQVSGYDEKQPLFVRNIVKRLVNFKPDPVRFNVLFDAIKRALENFAHSQPYSLSQHFMLLLLSQRFWSKEQLLAVCKDISIEDVENFKKEMMAAFHVEMFAHGNTTEKEVLDMASDVTETLKQANNICRPLFHNEYTPFREYSLSNGQSLVYRHFQSTHEVSSVELLFQSGIQNTKENALVELIVQLLREPAFNQLRTSEQLGYIVWTGSRLNSGTLGLQVIIQGPKEPDYVLSRIEAFMDKSRDDLVNMSDKDFNEQVEGLITRLQEKPKTLKSRNRRLWNEIECRQYDFDRNNEEVEVLRKLTKDDVLTFFDRKFAKGAPERKTVAIFVHGNKETPTTVSEIRSKREVNGEPEPEEIKCMEHIRESLALLPRPKPKLLLPPFGKSTMDAQPFDEKSKY